MNQLCIQTMTLAITMWQVLLSTPQEIGPNVTNKMLALPSGELPAKNNLHQNVQPSFPFLWTGFLIVPIKHRSTIKIQSVWHCHGYCWEMSPLVSKPWLVLAPEYPTAVCYRLILVTASVFSHSGDCISDWALPRSLICIPPPLPSWLCTLTRTHL